MGRACVVLVRARGTDNQKRLESSRGERGAGGGQVGIDVAVEVELRVGPTGQGCRRGSGSGWAKSLWGWH